MKTLTPTYMLAFLTLAGAWLCCGCAALNPQPPIEAFANKLADQAIIPAVKQGLAQGVRQLTVQAGAQGINPTYVVTFEGKWVTGIEGEATIGVDGLSGQMQITAAGDDETQPSPANPASDPEHDPSLDGNG